MTSKMQQHIDAAGRLAAIITHLGTECDQVDILAWCSEANVIMASDTKIPYAALVDMAGADFTADP